MKRSSRRCSEPPLKACAWVEFRVERPWPLARLGVQSLFGHVTCSRQSGACMRHFATWMQTACSLDINAVKDGAHDRCQPASSSGLDLPDANPAFANKKISLGSGRYSTIGCCTSSKASISHNQILCVPGSLLQYSDHHICDWVCKYAWMHLAPGHRFEPQPCR